MSSPIALVLDDVHVLHNSECRAAVSVLADHVPNGSRLVLAGRDEPPLQMARLRAEGRILEIGTGDLSLSREEASSLLRDAGVALGEEEVAELYRQTEGWPVGLYLAALYLKEGGSLEGAAVSFSGEDRFVSEFADRFSGSADLYATVGRVADRLGQPDRRRCHREHLAPPAARNQSRQCCQPHSVIRLDWGPADPDGARPRSRAAAPGARRPWTPGAASAPSGSRAGSVRAGRQPK